MEDQAEPEQDALRAAESLPASAAVVLVIDDDAMVADLLRRTLVKDGYRVEYAENGEKGLQLARQLRPDAITLDVMMPGMDGWQVLTHLKSDPELADIPVILLSIVNDRKTGFALGATEYLTKPFDRERLTVGAGAHFEWARLAAGAGGGRSSRESRTAEARARKRRLDSGRSGQWPGSAGPRWNSGARTPFCWT